MKRISIVILLISFVFVTLNAVYHKVGEISTSNSYAAIAIHEQLAFIGDDSLGLGIYNIDDPTTPVFLSNVELFSQIYRIELLGEYAFVMCADSTLQIVDVGDPYNPEIVSEYNLIQRGFRFCLNSNYAYIVEANENVEVVNIENPENPQYVNEFFLTNSGMSCDVSNTLAFIGTGFGLYVYDISNPDEMVEIGWFDTGNTHVVKIQGNLLYFAGVNGLGIIDFSDQNNLNLLSTNDELNFNDCVISDNILYGANEYEAIAVDISDSLSPTLIGSYVIIECCCRIDIANDHIFIDSILDGINIIDVSDPENIILLETQDIRSNKIAKSPDNQFMLMYGSCNDGLHFYKMDDPLAPELLYSHVFWDYFDCQSFYIDDDISCSVFGTIGLTNLYIYDHTNLEALTILCTFTINYNNNDWIRVRSITRKDEYLYLGCSTDGIIVLDISNPANVIQVSSYDIQGFILDLTVQDDYLYFVNIGGFRVFDISDPLNPEEIGYWDSNHRAEAFALMGDYAYVADFDGGLKVLDVSNPSNPSVINNITFNLSTRLDVDPIIRNNKLFVCDRYWNEIFVFDLTIPQNPVLIDSYRWDHYSNDIEIFDEYLYSANGANNMNNGFSILDFSDYITDINESTYPYLPNRITELSNYPNPFNPLTTISFQLSESSEVSLSIYNIKGQKIKIIVNDKLEQGLHQIIWDCKNDKNQYVASGVYFYKLKVNDKNIAIKKCLLLK